LVQLSAVTTIAPFLLISIPAFSNPNPAKLGWRPVAQSRASTVIDFEFFPLKDNFNQASVF
jgi:hypothetical protein